MRYESGQDDGVPNPYSTHLHNWKGGPLNEGSLFHGPNYTEPMFGLPWKRNPVWGMNGVDMYHADVRTRGGTFSNKGFGGGIFNGNTALGADSLPGLDLATLSKLVVWGLPNPAFIPVQVKLNAFLLLNGKPGFRYDGVLDESFCSAGRSLSTQQFDTFLNTLSPDELQMAYAATLQCMANGYIQPSALPCGVPGSTNPACGGGGVQPPVVPPITPPITPPIIPPITPPSLPNLTCPQGQIFDILAGKCAALPSLPGIPSLPSTPTVVCKPGEARVGDICIPNMPLPGKTQVVCQANETRVGDICIPNMPLKTPGGGGVTPAACGSGFRLNPTTGKCEVIPGVVTESKTNYLPWVLGGLAVVGIGTFVWVRSRKQGRR